MNEELDKYHSSSVNWRETLRQNNFRTIIVISLFFLIYIGIGLLVDMYLNSAIYPTATLQQLFEALVTFQLFPVVTLVMLVIASISLLVTFTLHNKIMLLGTDSHEITLDNASTVQEKQLYNVVDEMRIAAGLRYMPKVYIINANYMNAFASGYSEKSAMIAITRGLLEKLNRDELQAVMAHELSHIRHLDIKLTLTASLLANMTIIVLDIFFRGALYSRNSRSNGRSRNSLLVIIMILRFLLPVISVLLLLYLSRTRELMADAGCVALTRNNEPLASALIKINHDYTTNREEYTATLAETPHEDIRREAYLFDPSYAGLDSMTSINNLFSTHPSLEERLKALGYNKKI